MIEFEITNSGLVPVIREDESQSDSDQSYDHVSISNIRSPSPVVPFWLYENEADADLSSTSISLATNEYVSADYLRFEEFATAVEHNETSLDESDIREIPLPFTPNNEDPRV